MGSLWWRPLVTVAAVAVLAIAVWAFLGAMPALAAVAVAFGGLYLQNIINLLYLNRWLRAPDIYPVPQGNGVWQEVFSTISKLVRLQAASRSRLTTALARFQSAARAMPDGIVLLDSANRIEWCNPVAQIHLGLNGEGDRGAHLSYFLRSPDFVRYLAALDFAEPYELRTRDHVLTLQFVPFGDEQKMLISRDVTRFDQIDTMRRDFIANVSHELRTPLTVVSGFVETMHDNEFGEEERRSYLRLILSQTERMQRLIGDLLALSRLESAHTPLKEEFVDVPGLVEYLQEEACSLSNGRHHISMSVECRDGLLGSENELLSAFGNLVSNAVRYTPEGGEIEILWQQHGDERVFSVRDTGDGVAPEHIPRLTERFFRVDRSRSRETGGTGLGLSIVKHVLGRHGAHLTITSELGKGSVFSAHFPRSRARPPE